MTVKDIIKLSAKMLQKQEVVDFLNEVNFNDDNAKICDNLVDCYNLVASEIIDEYYPLEFTEEIVGNNGQFLFSQFTKTPLEILRCFFNDKEINFKVFPLYLEADAESLSVCYCYRPTSLAINDDSDFENSKISERILALGVAREYLARTSCYDEAMIFDGRFKNALQSVLFDRKIKTIKARGWF